MSAPMMASAIASAIALTVIASAAVTLVPIIARIIVDRLIVYWFRIYRFCVYRLRIIIRRTRASAVTSTRTRAVALTCVIITDAVLVFIHIVAAGSDPVAVYEITVPEITPVRQTDS